jgi:SNF2 family DNA or RNA helicase
MDVRVGRAGNGTPVFMIPGQSLTHGRIFGATWDEQRGLWMYPAFFPASEKVLADFDVISRDAEVVLSPVAQQHIATLATTKAALAARELPAYFDYITKPYAHQVDGLCHVFHNIRAALYFDPGLGKSKIAIDLVRLLRLGGMRGCALVLGPRVTVENWGREIDRHSDRQLRWVALVGSPKEKEAALDRAAQERVDIVLATYDTAKRIVDSLVARLPYEALILDESHNVKAWTSNRTTAAWEIAQKAQRRVLMTGSPTEGDPRDVYAPYKILGDCFMPEPHHKFARMVTKRPSERSHVVHGFKNLDLVNARTTFLSMRRTKEECLDLPARTFVDVDYRLTDRQTALYNQVVEDMGIDPVALANFAALLRAGAVPPALLPGQGFQGMTMPHRAVALLKLLQITSGFIINNIVDNSYCDTVNGGNPCAHRQHCVDREIKPRTSKCLVDKTPWPTETIYTDANPKHDAIAELIDSIIQVPDAKVIVWCVFHPEMDSIAQRVQDAGIGHVRVDGTTAKPMKVIDRFNDDPSVRVYIGQVASGVGVNLVSAAYVIYSSLPYALTAYLQSLDRNYRIGQDKPVTVYRMIGLQTLEAAVAFLLDHKVDVDALMTNKIECGLCPHVLRCQAERIEPFETGCIHPKTMKRPVLRAHSIHQNGG